MATTVLYKLKIRLISLLKINTEIKKGMEKKRASVKHRDALTLRSSPNLAGWSWSRHGSTISGAGAKTYKSELRSKFHTCSVTSRAAIPTSRPESSTRASPTIGRAFSNFRIRRCDFRKRNDKHSIGVVVAIRPPDSGSDRSNNRWMKTTPTPAQLRPLGGNE